MKVKLMLVDASAVKSINGKATTVKSDPSNPATVIRTDEHITPTMYNFDGWSETDSYSFNAGVSFYIEPSKHGLFGIVYGGQGEDEFHSVIQNSYGVFAAGNTGSFGAGNSDAMIVRTDFDGSVMWGKAIGTSSSDYIYGLHDTGSGILAVGYSDGLTSDDYDTPILISAGYDGSIDRVMSYTVQNNIAVTQSHINGNDIVVSGDYSDSQGTFSNMAALILGTDGSLVRAVNVGASGKYTYGRSVSITDNGIYVFVGDTNAVSSDRDLLVVKTSVTGSVLSVTTYPRNANTFGMSSTFSDGKIYIGGGTYESSGTIPYLLMLNSDGSVDRAVQITSSSMTGVMVDAVAATDDGIVLAINNTINDGSIVLIKMREDMAVEWAYKYYVKLSGSKLSLITSNGIIYLVGAANYGAGNGDALLVIIGSNGKTYLSTASYEATQVTVTDITDFSQNDASSSLSVNDITHDVNVADSTGSFTVTDITEDLTVTTI